MLRMSTCAVASFMRRNSAFGKAVERALDGLSQREASRRTGISPTYIGDLKWGLVPSFRVLERLVQGLDLPAARRMELFEAAGYNVGEADSSDSPATELSAADESAGGDDPDALVRRLLDAAAARPDELAYAPEWEGATVEGFEGAENLSPGDIEVANRVLRRVLSEQARRHGRQMEEE